MNMNIILGIIAIFFGLTMEVIWTGIVSFLKDKNKKLIGKVSLLMAPLYFVIPFVFELWLNIFPETSIFIRGISYMLSFFAVEYLYGWLLRSLKLEVWNYSKNTKDGVGRYYKYNIQGIITLEFIPAWYVAGIIGEIIYLFVLGII